MLKNMGRFLSWFQSAGALVLATACVTVHATDRLSTPAVQTQGAQTSLLLDIAASDTAVIAVGEQGTVLRKTDKADWLQVDIPTSELLTAVQFTSPTHAFAVGHGGVVLKSEDAGAHWSMILDGNAINQLQVDTYQGFLDQGGDPALSDFPVEEFEYLLDDASIALEEGPTQPILNLYFTDDQNGFLMGAYGMLLKTSDAGATWRVLSHRVPNPDRFHLTAMTEWMGALWMVGEAGLIFTSLDQGEHWQSVESPYDGSWFDVAVVDGGLWLAGLRGHLFEKTVEGDWQAREAGEHTLSHIAQCDQNPTQTLITGFGGTVLALKETRLAPLNTEARQAFSSAACWNNQWYLVGEMGVRPFDPSQAVSAKELP